MRPQEKRSDLAAAPAHGSTSLAPTVRTMSLAEGAAAKIASEISHGALRPGERLPSERELAKRFGLSRGALREGLRTLESAGIVSAHVGQGRYVNDAGSDRPSAALNTLMRLQPSGDILSVRRLLEPAAVLDIPAAQISATVDAMRSRLSQMRSVRSSSGIAPAVRSHTEFHLLLVRFASTRLLRSLLVSLIEASAAWQPAIMRDPEAAKFWVFRHAEILDALEAGDIELTAERVRSHVELPFSYPVVGDAATSD